MENLAIFAREHIGDSLRLVRAVLVCGHIDGPLSLVRADAYSISNGPILGALDPEIFDADDLYEMYNELAPNEDFVVKPLNYSGEDFNEAREIARQTHPGGWQPSEDYDGYVCYNGAYPFMAGSKWYAIYWYWVDVMDI